MLTSNSRTSSSRCSLAPVGVAIIVLIVVASTNQVSCSQASSSPAASSSSSQQQFLMPTSDRASFLIKRSLCNTFGGCGAKRSISSSSSSDGEGGASSSFDRRSATLDNSIGIGLPISSSSSINSNELFTDQEQQQAAPATNTIGADRMASLEFNRAKLISEILDDLFEHLQTDQRFKQGKFVVIVPTRTLNSVSDQSTMQPNRLSFMAQKDQQQQPYNLMMATNEQMQTMLPMRQRSQFTRD